MRKSLTILVAKFATLAARIFGNSGTALPGLVAQKLDSNILSKLTKNNFSKGIIVVTGTNGKTTTAKIIADVLKKQDVSTLSNKAGSNLYRGIVSTIIANCNLVGKCPKDIAVFEVDEAYVPEVCKALQPTIVVVTNLFRDQLDRYGELNSIKNNFDKTFLGLKSRLVLNADDPLVANLHTKNDKPVFFGVSSYNGGTIFHDHAADSIFDPITNEKLTYSKRYFGHIGKYSSPNSAYSRPKPNYDVVSTTKVSKNGVDFVLKLRNKQYHISSSLPGLYNIYNILAALTALQEVGISVGDVVHEISSLDSAFGRGESLKYKNKPLKLLLIKNPTGFNQIILTFLKPKPQNTPLLICINDKLADGTDVSWLWDSAIEDIVGYKARIIVSGSRCYDMALRLQYAGINNFEIEPNLTAAINKLSSLCNTKVGGYVLPTYTAMLELRKMITMQKIPSNRSAKEVRYG